MTFSSNKIALLLTLVCLLITSLYVPKRWPECFNPIPVDFFFWDHFKVIRYATSLFTVIASNLNGKHQECYSVLVGQLVLHERFVLLHVDTISSIACKYLVAGVLAIYLTPLTISTFFFSPYYVFALGKFYSIFDSLYR